MVQVLLPRKSNRAAQNIGFEAHVRVRKKQPFPCSGFVGFLEGMWLAEPAGRKIDDMNYTKPRMASGEFIQDPGRGILRTVVHGDDFQIRIIDFHQCNKCGGQFLFFVPRGQKNGNARAIYVGRRSNIPNHRETQCAVSNVEAVENPKRSDQCKENQSE